MTSNVLDHVSWINRSNDPSADMHSHTHNPDILHRSGVRFRDSRDFCFSFGVLITSLLIAIPVVLSCVSALFRDSDESPAPHSGAAIGGLLQGLPTLLVIAFLSAAIALPVSRLLASKPGFVLIALLPILMLPSYLAYAALDQLREPGSVLGNLILAAPAPVWSDDPKYWPVAVSRVQAILGLALWAWPIACAIQTFVRVRTGRSTFDAFALDRLRFGDRTMLYGRLILPGVCASAATVLIVVLGSAVPLHLANVRTQTQDIWLALQSGGLVEAWQSSAVLLTLTLFLAVGTTMLLRRGADTGFDMRPTSVRCRSRLNGVAFWTAVVFIWTLSLVPVISVLYLFVRSEQRFGAVVTNAMRDFARPALRSLVGGATAAAAASCLFIVLGVLGCRANHVSRRVALFAIGVFVWMALVPGVLVGAGVGQQWGRVSAAMGYPHWMDQMQVVLAHIARFGAIGGVSGWIAGVRTSRSERDAITIDGHGSTWRFFGLWFGSRSHAIAIVFLVVLTLSFHEIESAVMLAGPGMGSFPSQMLQLLHVFRWETLSVGVLMASVGSVLLVGMGFVLTRFR